MKRYTLLRIAALMLLCLDLPNCVIIQNSFNHGVQPPAVPGPGNPAVYWPPGITSWNTLDLQIYCEQDSTLTDLHLIPSPNPSQTLLSGYVRKLPDLHDSIHIQLFVPLGKNGIGWDTLFRFLPVSVTEVDSNRVPNKLRTYAARCRDAQGRSYYISGVTDPIPLIVFLILGGYYLYKYYGCESQIKSMIDNCAIQHRHPYWTFHLFSKCTFDSCGSH